jgi:hypothetical protein
MASALSPAARLVAFVLSTHMDSSGGSCFPGIRLVAEETGYVSNTVAAAVNELEATGFLSVQRGGGRRPNRYQAALPNVSAGETKEEAYPAGSVATSETVMSQLAPRSVSTAETEDVHTGRSGGRSTHVSPNGDTCARARQNERAPFGQGADS